MPVVTTLKMSKELDSGGEAEWKSEAAEADSESACLPKNIDLGLTCTRLEAEL